MENGENIKNKKFAQYVGYAIIYGNLPIIVVLIGALIWSSENLKKGFLTLISAQIGAAIAYLFIERTTIINFLFGSSQGSKDKDKITKTVP